MRITMSHYARAMLLALAVAGPCAAQTTAALLQKGIYTQETVGDLDGAIQIYRQVIAAPSSSRRDAAHAQSRIVQSLLKKGDGPGAARESDVLANRYADFKDLVSTLSAAVHPATASRVQLSSPRTRIQTVIRGTVSDAAGRPLRGARVRLNSR